VERDGLEAILKSKARLTKLVRDELSSDAEEYGDERRTRLVEREAAQAISDTELLTSEPTTVVLSRLGWVRAAKGHDIDVRSLSYKSGDEFQAAARGRNLQQAVFIDSTGRAYSLDAHQLPAARGYGEPLSGTVDPPDGATFAAVLIGEPDDAWLLASDAGYGFAVKLRELYSRNKKGKSVLKVPENSRVLPAQPIAQAAALAIFVNNDGEVLALPAAQIDELTAGKGQNLFGIPGKKSADRDEYLVAMAVVAPGEVLTIHSGLSAPMKLKYEELKQFQDRKGQRRQRFSRAYKQVDRLEISAG
jgi:topoisomerase IV subunit A